MHLNNFIPRILLIPVAILMFINSATAQETKAREAKELFKEIAYMDSVLFEAFNTRNMEKFKAFFTPDLEWFQDNDGVKSYQKVFEDFESIFKKEYKLTRQLVKGSLEVHPVKDYGAIEIGSHQFHHIENGKEVIGTFKFVMIWQKKDGQWKISRVISYDH